MVATQEVIEVGSLRVNLAGGVATSDGRLLKLTYQEWALLEALAMRPGHVVPFDTLADEVWGYHKGLRPNLRVLVCRLRSRGVREVRTFQTRGYGLFPSEAS